MDGGMGTSFSRGANCTALPDDEQWLSGLQCLADLGDACQRYPVIL